MTFHQQSQNGRLLLLFSLISGLVSWSLLPLRRHGLYIKGKVFLLFFLLGRPFGAIASVVAKVVEERLGVVVKVIEIGEPVGESLFQGSRRRIGRGVDAGAPGFFGRRSKVLEILREEESVFVTVYIIHTWKNAMEGWEKFSCSIYIKYSLNYWWCAIKTFWVLIFFNWLTRKRK